MADPSLAAYFPAGHDVHAATFEPIENLPTAHGVQILAPVPVPVFVIEPAPQSVHEESVDFAEYLPAAHSSHVVAPAPVPILVIEPAAHSEQYDLPRSD